MRTWWLVLTLSTLPVGTLVVGQQARVVGGEQTPAAVAQLLVERGTVAELPVKGKVSRKIEMEADAFALPSGPSRVVLLRLPEYRAPYVVTVKSFLYKRALSRTEKIFVPTTIVLDGDYRITRTVSEAELEANGAGMVKGAAVGTPLRVVNQRVGLRAERSADGDIEAETKPTK